MNMKWRHNIAKYDINVESERGCYWYVDENIVTCIYKELLRFYSSYSLIYDIHNAFVLYHPLFEKDHLFYDRFTIYYGPCPKHPILIAV